MTFQRIKVKTLELFKRDYHLLKSLIAFFGTLESDTYFLHNLYKGQIVHVRH